MKQRILELRAEGKTYDEIVEIVGCSKGTVAYHCGEGVKAKYLIRRNSSRRAFSKNLKLEFGGKCMVCSYDKCLDALHFHHTDDREKDGDVSNIAREVGFAAAREEARKCVLVCANCHSEIHAGLINLTECIVKGRRLALEARG